jgi:hypothetical protein
VPYSAGKIELRPTQLDRNLRGPLKGLLGGPNFCGELSEVGVFRAQNPSYLFRWLHKVNCNR